MGTRALPTPGVQRTPLNRVPRAKTALNEGNIDWTGHSALTGFLFIQGLMYELALTFIKPVSLAAGPPLRVPAHPPLMLAQSSMRR